jgi:sugar phosphate isomerase/epimerase
MAAPAPLQLRHILNSALYGNLSLDEILPEVAATRSEGLDLWCLPHGDQREQVEKMGLEAFAEMLTKTGVKISTFTRYKLGPFGLQDEMKVVKQLGGKMIVTGTGGPNDVSGAEARTAMKAFLEKLKPHADAAGEHGLQLTIENHKKSLLSTPDSIRAWAELADHPAIGVCFAPHHLHEHVDDMPKLIRELGAKKLNFIYLQEHGIGAWQKEPKEIELQQLPGYGTLDYKPILTALRDIGFSGYANIFMHPTPRGVPILPTAKEISAAVLKARDYIDKVQSEVNA